MMRKLTTVFAAALVLLTLPATVSAQSIRGDSISDNPMYFRLFMPMVLYRSAVSEAITPEQTNEVDNDSLLPIKPLDMGYDNTLAKMIDETLMKIYLEHPELVEMTEAELMDVPGVLPISEDIVSGIHLKDNRTGYGPASVSPERVDSKLRYWKTFGNFQGKYTQSYYSDNWYKGGESNHSILGQINLEADYASNDSIKVIEKKIAAQDGVREVTWQKDLLDIINSNIRKVAGLLLILAMILSLVSFTLINNTIKLTIYAQRFVLYSMKLVGAKWSFIRKPFIRRNLWIGFTSAVLTCIIIWYGLKIGLKYEPWLIMLAEPRIIIPVFAMVTLIGLLITGICALHSVNRFLRMKSGELHYV